MTPPVTVFEENFHIPVRGRLHHPEVPSGEGLVLAHGAGSNCEAPLLAAVAGALTSLGVTVLRIDLPYRQLRPAGPPIPAMAARDREGLKSAVAALRKLVTGPLFAGGHSYGGRQASMAAAEDSTFADGLLLLSYPLHPPRRPEQPRTAHLPNLHTRSLFVHGSRDPFGTFEELRAALALIPAETRLLEFERAGHELTARNKRNGAAGRIAQAFTAFFR